MTGEANIERLLGNIEAQINAQAEAIKSIQETQKEFMTMAMTQKNRVDLIEKTMKEDVVPVVDIVTSTKSKMVGALMVLGVIGGLVAGALSLLWHDILVAIGWK